MSRTKPWKNAVRTLPTPSLYVNPVPRYPRLSSASKSLVDTLDARHARPSQLKALAEGLFKDGAISATQKIELTHMRKPYALEGDDSPFDLVSEMESGVAFATDFEKRVPSGSTAYYQGMVRFAKWIEQTATLHRKAPLFQARA